MKKLPLKLQRLLRVHLALARQALTLKQSLVLKSLDLVKDLARNVTKVHLALQVQLALEQLEQVQAWDLVRAHLDLVPQVRLVLKLYPVKALALQTHSALKPLDPVKALAWDPARVHLALPLQARLVLKLYPVKALALQTHLALKPLDPVKALAWDLAKALL